MFPIGKLDKGCLLRVERGFALILREFPNSVAVKNQRAYLAAVAGQRAKAQQYFLESNGEADLREWNGKKTTLEKFLMWTFGP